MSLNKKVLHVVNISFVIPYYIGDQFDYFQEKGYEFYVACTPSEHLLTYAAEKKFTPVPTNILRAINILEDIKSILKLKRLIKQENIDFVIGHTPKGALVGITAAWLAGVSKRVYFRHGIMYETSKGLKRILLKGIEKFSGAMAAKVICVSPSVLEISKEEHLSNPSKNYILGNGTCNGIDTVGKFNPQRIPEQLLQSLKEKYGIREGDRIIGYVGRLVNDKGIKELIAAWKLLLQEHQHIKLLLVGPFEERDSIPEETKAYITGTPSIIHTGLVGDSNNFYGLMDMFILPSYREGFPTVVLEASSMKLPVLTTRATGCRDSIVEGETGLFIEHKAEDIAQKIGFYLSNPQIAVAHGEKGRRFVCEQFDQNVVWQEIDKIVFKETK